MSTQVYQTGLGTDWFQIFPAEVVALNRLLTDYSFSGGILDKVAGQVKNYITMDRPTTDDGYVWFWALYFNLPAARLAVLIPWMTDSSQRDGSRADRSVSVYIKGNFSISAISDIIAKTKETILELCGYISEEMKPPLSRKRAS